MRALVVIALAAMIGAASGAQRVVQVIAHRGASWDAPEHTFASWDLALDQGADWIEQDLQMTRDGALVVLHDDSLDRTARGPAADCRGLVRERTLAALRRCEVGSWFNAEFPQRAQARFVGAVIPTLDSVLVRYAGRARFYIETKSPQAAPGMEDSLLALLGRHGLAGAGVPTGRVIIQSFSRASLERLHALDSTLALVLLIEDPIAPDTLDAALSAIRRFAVGIGPKRSVLNARLVARAHAAGLVVHPYTVNDSAAMAFVLRLGVDGMFTDRPGLLRRVLAR